MQDMIAHKLSEQHLVGPPVCRVAEKPYRIRHFSAISECDVAFGVAPTIKVAQVRADAGTDHGGGTRGG